MRRLISSHGKPGMQRWLLPYADLLTVLFVAVLAIKVTPPQPVKPPPVNTLAKAEPVVTKSGPAVPLKPEPVPAHLRQALKAWRVTPRGEITLTLPQNVLFASNQYQLTTAGARQLQKLAPVLQHSHGRIRVEGHTDNQLPAKPLTNRQLSALRASVVADALTQQLKLPARRLVAMGHGDAYPLSSNQTDQGRQTNRRVVLIIEPDSPKPITKP
jgi:outer membrane protein OmpA-like peptidoglycan-associated protein